MKLRVSGLYAVTPDFADTQELLAKVEAALAGGARLLQYRNKSASPETRLAQGRSLQGLCRKYRVPLIINDYLDLALTLDADGLHLGAADGSLAQARVQLGPYKLLGASCYDRIEDAINAARAGADYLAFGSFFSSSVKPDAARPPLALIDEAKLRLALPIVAIGGVTLENAPRLVAAGADGIAVISALFGASDVKLTARRFSALFAGDRREMGSM